MQNAEDAARLPSVDDQRAEANLRVSASWAGPPGGPVLITAARCAHSQAAAPAGTLPALAARRAYIRRKKVSSWWVYPYTCAPAALIFLLFRGAVSAVLHRNEG